MTKAGTTYSWYEYTERLYDLRVSTAYSEALFSDGMEEQSIMMMKAETLRWYDHLYDGAYNGLLVSQKTIEEIIAFRWKLSRLKDIRPSGYTTPEDHYWSFCIFSSKTMRC